jgi:uncharacterized protein YqhQ
MEERFHYGGQAVIEGVMIRGQKAVATVGRRPNGGLAFAIQPLATIFTGWMRKTPLIRGIVVLIEALTLGIKALLYSANISLEEEEEVKVSRGLIWSMLIVALAIAVALFFIAPLFLTKLIEPYISSSLLFHLIEGCVRLVIFIAYLKLVTLVPDLRRTFAYHGAEHKTIHAYEDGATLEVEAVRKYHTAHTRCGTSPNRTHPGYCRH